MKLSERDYYLGFSVSPDIGPKRFKLLLFYFGSAKSAWEASDNELYKINLRPSIVRDFSRFRKNFFPESFSELLKKKKISFLTTIDSLYPSQLCEIPDPPIVIYIRGDVNIFKKIKTTVAIVGTRMMTDYGKNATEKIVAGLSKKKVTIVSGLAEGIDTVAHEIAIENGGITLAILGSGIDVVYPYRNYKLYWQIVNGHGLIISEYPPGYKPTKSSFPLRNRIISGLSQAVVVVEGKRISGALITAKYAAEQGREVFAVPGPINTPFSEATSYLIKNGASIASSAEDILLEIV